MTEPFLLTGDRPEASTVDTHADQLLAMARRRGCRCPNPTVTTNRDGHLVVSHQPTCHLDGVALLLT